ncbi:Fanconi anemia group E protein [Oncorhynchus tshawytscha]|uniref:Fanconi Anaemia group E protein C-terminal domain-containing protein n=1 Tax=Oncorhynchus tshawytscha TaxID=74940 RepID=A0AAZ3QFD8_ONCTS|nr:Fanconi anemia group E protein [Oncorhynchus tshawytscha]
MDTNTLLLRFDGRSRLLLRSLLSGATGARRGLWVFQRQRRSDPDRCLHTCLETLCQQEICLNSDAETLTTKPLVCLFPVAFQRSLVSFLHLTHPLHPRTSVLHLLDCLSQGEHAPNPWVSALVVQLRRDLGAPGGKEPLITPQCRERLRGLCERLRDSGGGDDKATGWALCLGGPIEPQLSSSSQGGLDVVPKRKSSCVDLDSEPEDDAGQQRKRMRISLSPVDTERSCSSMEYVVGTEGLKDEMETDRVVGVIPEPAVEPQQAAGSPSDALPENVKASIPQIKEILESEMEWDQNSVDIFKVLNDCDPSQVEILCRMLSLSEMPEQTLPQLCSCLLELSPDLSHGTAATLIKSLLLGKVLSLSEPASRCLVTAVTSLCSRYPRPTCHALIGPVLEEGQTGSAQAELLNRLIEDCLDPHYRLLVFQMTIKGIWCEGLLSVIHALLDKKLELNEELFTLFTDQLSSQAPHFTKSMKYAKMMLTVLTKYNTHVTVAHKHTLSCCLSSNETFLKKSLQAALKRIKHS